MGELSDPCTLNNLLNVVQVAILAALLKWLREDHRELKQRSDRRQK